MYAVGGADHVSVAEAVAIVAVGAHDGENAGTRVEDADGVAAWLEEGLDAWSLLFVSEHGDISI